MEPLLKEVGKSKNLVEKNSGVFYNGPQAYLHFHEDSDGIFADVKKEGKWIRLKVPARKDWKRFSRKLTPP